MLNIYYECPECGHEWEEEYECACDSECEECGCENITALRYEEIEGSEDESEEEEN